MWRLLISDVRRHGGAWAWALVVAAVAAACAGGQVLAMTGAIEAAQAVPAPGRRSELVEEAVAVTTFALGGIGIAVVCVLTAAVSTILWQRSRAYGLWRALGLGPGRLRVVVLGQAALVGLAGAGVGLALARPVAEVLMSLMADNRMAVASASPSWSWTVVWSVPALVMASVVAGSWGAARRVSRLPEVELLAGRGRARRWSVGRVLGLLVKLSVVVSSAVGLVAAAWVIAQHTMDLEDAMQAAAGACLGVLALAAATTSWLAPALTWAASHLPVPGVAWHVATRTALRQARESSACALPFVVAGGLVAVMFGMTASVPDAYMPVGIFLLTFGLALATSWAGGVAVIAMSASRRRRDGALLVAAGAQPGTALATQVIEGVLHAVVASCLTLAISLAVSAYLAAGLGRGYWDVVAHGPWAALGVTALLTVVTTCLAVVLSARLGGRETTAQLLRARD